MDYTILRGALTNQQCDDYIAIGEAQYLLTNPDQKIGTRRYPGFTLANAGEELLILGALAQTAGVEFDYGAGTGVNYINAVSGEQVGPHIDKPLHLIEDIQAGDLAKYQGRFCAVSVLAALTSSYTGGSIDIEGEEIRLEQGDAVVIKGYTLHQLNPIETGTLQMLAAFFCTNGN